MKNLLNVVWGFIRVVIFILVSLLFLALAMVICPLGVAILFVIFLVVGEDDTPAGA